MGADALAVPAYWRRHEGPSPTGATVLRPLAVSLMNVAWDLRVYRRDLVPGQGPVILAANHTGILDGPVLYAVAPRPVHALVKQEMFRGFVGRGLRALGQIAVDRFRVDIAALKSCLATLERGDVLGIYPEGSRGGGDFSRIKPGVAYVALCSGAPVVPVVSLGTRTDGGSVGSMPRPRSRIDVVFGRPIQVEPIGWPRRRASVAELADSLQRQLMDHVRQACALTGRQLPDRPIPWRPT